MTDESMTRLVCGLSKAHIDHQCGMQKAQLLSRKGKQSTDLDDTRQANVLGGDLRGCEERNAS